ncbi:MAG: hypothetical protein NTZ80_00400, partial [Patescibacteria group bacterium]|nr:hypothetical protein [Patescibacteria group bacterium]
MEPITATALIVGGGAWIGDKILGPTAKIIGKDLKKLYEKGRDKIMEKSASKIPDFNDRKQSNLRVTRDVF